MTTRTRITATPMYPGSLFPEDGRPVVVPDSHPPTAIEAVPDDGRWFCIEVRKVRQKRWTDGDGGEMWRDDGKPSTYRIYVGEELTADDVAQMPDGKILLSNMTGNGWPTVVRTRCGNYQPVERGDVVLSPAELSA